MNHTPNSLALVGLCAALASCASDLRDPAWSHVGSGSHSLGVSSGWAFYGADVTLEDQTGDPELGRGTDYTDLEPIGGAALKYNYFLTDHAALGFIFEARSFDPDPVAPLDSTIDADEYTSLHFLLSTRYWSNPFGSTDRWKWFTGLDLDYSPGVNLDATVVYAPGFQERVELDGDDFWTINPVLGISYLLQNQLSLEFGGFWEFPIDPSEDTITLNIPNGQGGTDENMVDGSLDPEGLILFLGLTYYL